MCTFDQSLFDLRVSGRISLKDALRNADSVSELKLAIKLNGSRKDDSPAADENNKPKLELEMHADEDEDKLPQCLLQDYSGLGWTGISIKNAAYPLVVASVLDILGARDGRVSETAERLGMSTARLVAFFRRDAKLWGQVNSIRQESGQRRLR